MELVYIKTFASKELSSISKYQCKQILKKYSAIMNFNTK